MERRRRIAYGVAAAALASVAACGTAQQAEERYVAYCAAQGLSPGSEMFTDCVQSQRMKDVIEARRIREMRNLRALDR